MGRSRPRGAARVLVAVLAALLALGPAAAEVWAWTSVAADYDGASVVPHWLAHYAELGVAPARVLVVVNSNVERYGRAGLDAAVAALAKGGVPAANVLVWEGKYSSEAMYRRRMALQERVPIEDWIVHADSDELHTYGGKRVTEFLAAADAAGINEVRGFYVDRVAADGTLKRIEAEPTLFLQYPLRCDVIGSVVNSRSNKAMAYKGYWRTDRGNHQILRPARAANYLGGPGRGSDDDVFALTPYAKHAERYAYQCQKTDDPGTLPLGVACGSGKPESGLWAPNRQTLAKDDKGRFGVHHFKWHAGVVKSVQDRLQYYRGDEGDLPGGSARLDWWKDSDKLKNQVTGKGKVDVKGAKCRGGNMRAF